MFLLLFLPVSLWNEFLEVDCYFIGQTHLEFSWMLPTSPAGLYHFTFHWQKRQFSSFKVHSLHSHEVCQGVLYFLLAYFVLSWQQPQELGIILTLTL